MSVENGEWIMYGVEESDPACIHSVEELVNFINEVGFLPLFRNEILGFSVEERTVPDFWWSGDIERDPWEWRALISRSGDAVYGKVYDNKTGFISKEWFPYFSNVKRDGYDFDALWDDGKASARQKKIMDLFLEENLEQEYYSNELKEKAGFGKNGEKGFDGVLNALQMQTYLVVRDFRQRKNKKGDLYGWPIAVYVTPEHLLGRDVVTAAYSEEPEDSAKRIVSHILEQFPEASEEAIGKIVLGRKRPHKQKTKKNYKKVQYPVNLLKELKLKTSDGKSIDTLDADRMIGLEHALSLLTEKEQNIIFLRFEKGMTYEEIGKVCGKSSTACSGHWRKAKKKLLDPRVSPWITDGFIGYSKKKDALVRDYLERIAGSEIADVLKEYIVTDVSEVFGKNISKALHSKSINNIGDLAVVIDRDCKGIRMIPGIGDSYYNDIFHRLYILRLITKDTYEKYGSVMYGKIQSR